MKRLAILLLVLSLFSCKKPSYQPCECMDSETVATNQTVIPGLFFGSTWDEVAESGVFDTLIHFDNEHPYMASHYGGLPANIVLGFGYTGVLEAITIQFPYGRVTEDSVGIYLNVWQDCITDIYGSGCFQRIQQLHGWSKEGFWQWDFCGGPRTTLWGAIENYWKPAR